MDCLQSQRDRNPRRRTAARAAASRVAGLAAGLAVHLGRAGSKWQDIVVQLCMEDDDGNFVRGRRQVRERPVQDDRPLVDDGSADGQERLRQLTEELFTLLAGGGSPTASPQPGAIPRSLLAELTLAANSVGPAALPSEGNRPPLPEPSLGGNPCIAYPEFHGCIQGLLSAVSTNGVLQELALQHLIADLRSGNTTVQRFEQAEPEMELVAEPEEEPGALGTAELRQS